MVNGSVDMGRSINYSAFVYMGGYVYLLAKQGMSLLLLFIFAVVVAIVVGGFLYIRKNRPTLGGLVAAKPSSPRPSPNAPVTHAVFDAKIGAIVRQIAALDSRVKKLEGTPHP